MVLRGHEKEVQSAAFCAGRRPHHHRLVVYRTARIWDAATGKEIATLRGHEDVVQSAAFSSDGTHVVTASHDTTSRIWDVRLATLPTHELITEVCQNRLRELSTLTREEMQLVGFSDEATQIDVCAG